MDIISIIFGNLAIVAMLAVVIAIVGGGIVVATRYVTVPPNTAVIVSGRRGTRVVTGGGTLVLPLVETAKWLSLEIMTINIEKRGVHTIQGVPIDFTGVVQFKVAPGQDAILTAARAFLDQKRDEIRQKLEETLDGHLRSICGTMTPIEIVTDRKKFSAQVVDAAEQDLKGMGFTIPSLTVKEIKDSKGYYEAWGKPDIAEITKKARIAEAEAMRDARRKEALAEQEAVKQEQESLALRAEYEKVAEVKRANYKREVETQIAIAEQAKPIENAKQLQKLKEEEVEINVIEQKKQIEVVEHLKKVKEKEGEAQRIYAIKVAEGASESMRLTGKGEGEKERSILEGKAAGKKADLLAEAEGIEKRAIALQKLDEAGLKVELMKYLPDMVKEAGIATDKIGGVTIIQSGDTDKAATSTITNSVVDIVTKVPAILQAYGIDIAKILEGDPNEIGKVKEKIRKR
jgi:flotillin